MIHTIKKQALVAALFLLPFTSLLAQSENEPNDGLGTADVIGLSTQVTGFIGESGDQDYFQFTISSAGIIDFSLSISPSDIQLEAFVYNSTSQQIAYERAPGSGLRARYKFPSQHL